MADCSREVVIVVVHFVGMVVKAPAAAAERPSFERQLRRVGIRSSLNLREV